MRELSIFVDESGDFGSYESHALLSLYAGIPRTEGLHTGAARPVGGGAPGDGI